MDDISLQNLLQHVHQLRNVNRLGDVAVHAGVAGFLAILVKSVRGHGDDGDGGFFAVVQRADVLRRFVAVHDGHLNVHQNEVIRTGGRILDGIHRLRSIVRGVDNRAFLFQNRLCDFLIQLDVIDEKDFLSRKEFGRLLRFRLGDKRTSRSSERKIGFEQNAVTPASRASCSMSAQS